MEREQKVEDTRRRLQKCIDELSEHFDTVQIFVSHYEGPDTYTSNLGTGNWYARFGQIKSWILKSEREEKSDHHDS